MRKPAAAALAFLALHGSAGAEARRYGAPPPDIARHLDRLVAAYPDHLAGHDGTHLEWRDGTRMPISDGRSDKSFEELLDAPDIDDMFAFPYPSLAPAAPPPADFDPGRIRHDAFFARIYGDCRRQGAAGRMARVTWMPETAPQTLPFNEAAGAADALRAVVAELERLPGQTKRDLSPSAGTFNCRPIAGTNRLSAHGHGIAIDIATANADYWRWAKRAKNGAPAWRNRIAQEIVRVFERHGFIWGGRWSHFDTMHFEYRPEFVPPMR